MSAEQTAERMKRRCVQDAGHASLRTLRRRVPVCTAAEKHWPESGRIVPYQDSAGPPGDIPAPRLAALHGPAGLAIGAIEPEEIALSIVSEIVSERRSKNRAASALDVAAV